MLPSPGLSEHEFSLAWNRSWLFLSAANQTARAPCQNINGLALRAAIMVIDAIALIVTLEQASAHQFRHRPAHIRLARSPYLLTDGVFDHSRGLTRSEEHTSELQSLMRN